MSGDQGTIIELGDERCDQIYDLLKNKSRYGIGG